MIQVKVLGSGCTNCKKLEENVKRVIQEMGIDADVQKVTDFAAIASYNVIKTPGLVVDEKVVSYGKVTSEEEIKSIFTNLLAD